MKTSVPLNSEFWERRYHEQNTGWDIGYISAPLKEYFDQLTNKSLRILIPGCGNSYEAEYLYNKGFTEVYLLDFSATALKNFHQRVPLFPESHLVCEDFFEHKGQYDLIVEQTFFCAIDPERRTEYAKKMSTLLRPSGTLAGLFFDCAFEKEGPPFGGSREEYKAYFQPCFHLHHFDTAYNSIPQRAGRELFAVMVKK